MVGCAAIGCTNSTDKRGDLNNVPRDASFHAFPLKNAELLQKWLENLGRKDFHPKKHSKLCSAHFLPHCFDVPVPAMGGERKRALRRLFKDAVPTEFCWGNRPLDTPVPGVVEVEVHGETTTQDVQQRTGKQDVATTSASSRVDDQQPISRKRTRTSTVTREMLQQESDSEEHMETMSWSTSLSEAADVEVVSMPTSEQSTHVEFATAMDTYQEQTPENRRQAHLSPTALQQEVVETVPLFVTPVKIEAPPARKTSKIAVHSLFGTPHRTGADHPYSKRKRFRTFGTQTVAKSPAKCPTPAKSPTPEASSPLTSPFKSDTFEEEMSEYAPISDTSSSSSSPDTDEQSESDPCKMRKFIVFEENLNELHKYCKVCGSAVTQRKQFMNGSMVGYKIACHNGDSYVWHSQPLDRKQPMGNLLIAAAILITGGTFGKMKSFADACNLAFFTKTLFNKLQKLFLLPTIQEYWETERKKACEEVRPLTPIVLAGDGRCDSPGHSAKYGSYTLMHSDGDGKAGSRKIVSMKLVQVSEVKNSNHMEPEGLKRCLKQVADEQLEVGVLATDRHIMISSIMKKEYKEINHQFDTWHLAKSVIKKLTAISKTKTCTDLSPWIQSISNHLWWACATCEGDEQLLREKWLSLLHHVRNNHHWSGNQKYHACAHPPLSRGERKKIKWLKPNTPSFLALQKLLLDTKLLKAIGQLDKFCHTGELEVFHSMLLKFCPKRQHFHYDAMTGRLMLAAIEWNQSRREQKTDQRGKPATSVEFSKRRKVLILKNRYQKVKSSYSTELLTRIYQVHHENIKLKPIERPLTLPQNVAVIEKPTKEELEAKFKSRFR